MTIEVFNLIFFNMSLSAEDDCALKQNCQEITITDGDKVEIFFAKKNTTWFFTVAEWNDHIRCHIHKLILK